LRHAQARNVIERIFGVLKKRFAAAVKPMQYSIRDQGKIVQALCVIHNFIRIHDPNDIPDIDEDDEDDEDPDYASVPGNLTRDISRAEREEAAALRDKIANEMWSSYQKTVRRRARRT
jgi:hypothetical protein